MTKKKCCACQTKKSEQNFWADKSRKDGLSPMCVPCAKAANASNYLKHKDARLEYQKAYDLLHSDEIKAKGRLYYAANREKMNEYSKAYYRANIVASRARYQEKRLEILAAAKAKRLAEKLKTKSCS